MKKIARGGGDGQREKPSLTKALAPSAPDVLSRAERLGLDEIVEKATEWLDGVDEGWRAVCAMVLSRVFQGDARAMAAPGRMKGVGYDYLVGCLRKDRRFSARGFSLMLRVAAYDHLVKGPSWAALGFTVKARLLPLADPAKPTGRDSLAALAAGASHAFERSLTAAAAEAFVQQKLLADGRGQRHNARRRTYERHVETSLRYFEHAAALAHLERVTDGMTTADVGLLRTKLERAAKALAAAARRIKGRGTR